jgi:hypothetical protein
MRLREFIAGLGAGIVARQRGPNANKQPPSSGGRETCPMDKSTGRGYAVIGHCP